MPRFTYANCKRCGGNREEVGDLSWTRLCVTCSVEVVSDNLEGMATMRGPYAQHWRRQMAASVGAIFPDEARS